MAEGFDGAPLASLFPPGLFDPGRGGGGAAGRGGMAPGWEAAGGKMGLVARLLSEVRRTTDDKAVVVSNYTQARRTQPLPRGQGLPSLERSPAGQRCTAPRAQAPQHSPHPHPAAPYTPARPSSAPVNTPNPL